MRKLVFAAFFCAVANIASAQFILGGQFTLGVQTDKDEYDVGDDDETKTTVVAIVPRLIYDRGDNLWIGGDVGVTFVTEKDNFGGEDDTDKSTLFSLAPFARYIWKPADKVGIWCEGQIGVNFGSREINDDKIAEFFGFGAGVRPGVIFFIGDRLSFETSFGSLGFSSFRSTDPDNSENKNTVSRFGLSANNNLGGTSFLLGDPFSIGGFTFGVNYRL